MKPQPVNIGGIECDALIHHELSLEMEIPDYPVEEGFSVQDTMIQKPKTLSLTVIVTNTPITFRSHASPGESSAGRFPISGVVRKARADYRYFCKRYF